MAFGLDYITAPPISDMKAAKVEFVCRYTGYFSGYDITRPSVPQGKVLTPGEARANNQAGISNVSNWEWYERRVLEGFNAGAWDAQEAFKIHSACGGPPNRPIYFSADLDCEGSQVLDYFHGVASVLGLARTGAYGSYKVLKYLFDVGAIAWGWQTYAWSYGQWEPRCQLQQYQNKMYMSGFEVDYDRSTVNDYGQWGVQTMSTLDVLLQHGWSLSADKQTLYGPNKVPVRMGFKAHIEGAPSWNPADVPLAAEYGVPSVLDSHPELGSGTTQPFLYRWLIYTVKTGVQESPTGLELQTERNNVAKWITRAADLQKQLDAALKNNQSATLAMINNLAHQIEAASAPAV